MAKIWGVDVEREHFFSMWRELLGHEPTLDDWATLLHFGVDATLSENPPRLCSAFEIIAEADGQQKWQGEYIDDARTGIDRWHRF